MQVRGVFETIHVKSERLRVTDENKSCPFSSCKTTVAACVF